jgi:hypothetical protein
MRHRASFNKTRAIRLSAASPPDGGRVGGLSGRVRHEQSSKRNCLGSMIAALYSENPHGQQDDDLPLV